MIEMVNVDMVQQILNSKFNWGTKEMIILTESYINENKGNIDYDAKFSSGTSKAKLIGGGVGSVLGYYAGDKLGSKLTSNPYSRLGVRLTGAYIGDRLGEKAANTIRKRYLKHKLKKDNIEADKDTFNDIYDSKNGEHILNPIPFKITKDKKTGKTVVVSKKKKHNIIGMEK